MTKIEKKNLICRFIAVSLMIPSLIGIGYLTDWKVSLLLFLFVTGNNIERHLNNLEIWKKILNKYEKI